METVLQEFDHDLVIDALVIAMCAGVEYLNVNLAPAKYLRNELSQQLRSKATPLLADADGSGQDSLERSVRTAETPALPAISSTYQFKLTGGFWTAHFGDEAGFFPDGKGSQYIARLLSNPNKWMSSLELIGGSRMDMEACRSFEFVENLENEEDIPAGDSAQEALDERARSEYGQKLLELSDELEKAREMQDTNRVEQLEAEYDAVKVQLRAALRLGAKGRPLGTPAAKKATESVRKVLHRVYGKMAASMPSLVRHFRQNIAHEDVAYIYRPSPTPDWQL